MRREPERGVAVIHGDEIRGWDELSNFVFFYFCDCMYISVFLPSVKTRTDGNAIKSQPKRLSSCLSEKFGLRKGLHSQVSLPLSWPWL
jgi:hypothetical protein